MENYYEVLKCSPEAGKEELKQSYQRLVLRLHPDKIQQSNSTLSQQDKTLLEQEYHRVDRAWSVLGDPDLRKEYDARWHQRAVAQQWPIQDEVEFGDFDYDMDSKEYTYECRCGGQYILSENDAKFRMDYVACPFCSLCVKVVHEDLDEQFSPAEDVHREIGQHAGDIKVL